MAAVLLDLIVATSVLLGSLAALTFNWSVRLGLLLEG